MAVLPAPANQVLLMLVGGAGESSGEPNEQITPSGSNAGVAPPATDFHRGQQRQHVGCSVHRRRWSGYDGRGAGGTGGMAGPKTAESGGYGGGGAGTNAGGGDGGYSGGDDNNAGGGGSYLVLGAINTTLLSGVRGGNGLVTIIDLNAPVPTGVPEPASLAVLGAGVVGLLGWRHRQGV